MPLGPIKLRRRVTGPDRVTDWEEVEASPADPIAIIMSQHPYVQSLVIETTTGSVIRIEHPVDEA